jgi:hypothetical protein
MAQLWSAVTCHRFLRPGDWSPSQPRVQRGEERSSDSRLRSDFACGQSGALQMLDGDKSPPKSDDKSSHSKSFAAQPTETGR